MKVSSKNHLIELVEHNNIHVSDPEKGIEIVQRDDETLLIVTPNKVHTLRCLNIDRATKEVTLLHQGQKHTLKISEPIDEILASMGLEDALIPKIDFVKAPMPGLVLDVKVQPGDTIKKGETLLINNLFHAKGPEHISGHSLLDFYLCNTFTGKFRKLTGCMDR